MSPGVRLAIMLLPVLGGGCGSRVVAPHTIASSLRPADPFVPGTTSPTRKAKLEALAPKLDDILRARMHEAGVTGLVAGVVLDGELAYARAFGVRDIASNSPVDGNTVFRIASMTKSFTAMAIMKLRDEGRLSLDTDAAVYLPGLRGLRGLPRDASITVRMLLTHASGLPSDDYWGGDTFGMTDAEFARFLQNGVQMADAPGARYAYSNLGYALLGRIVEQVSGRGFREYVSDEILKPLGMSASAWDERNIPSGRLATGYWKNGTALVAEPRPWDGVFAAAGGLYTSLHDYARYVAFNLAAYPARDDEPEAGPLRRSTVREMHEGQRWARTDDRDAPVAQLSLDGISLRAASYGFGWLKVTSCNDDRVQHGGYEPGYFSTVVLLPGQAAGVFIFATTARLPAAALLPALAEGGVLDTPARAPPIPELVAAAVAIERLLVAWDDALAARTFDAASLRFSWFVNLRDDFARLGARHGRCQRRGTLVTYGRHRAVWTLACDRGSVELDALMTPGTPASVEIIKWTDDLPPDGRQRAIASRLSAALGRWSEVEAATNDLFAETADRYRLTKHLAHLAVDHGPCSVVDGVVRVAHEPFGDDTPHMIFQLRCAGGPLELEVTTDETGDRLLDLKGHPPRDHDATCWQ